MSHVYPLKWGPLTCSPLVTPYLWQGSPTSRVERWSWRDRWNFPYTSQQSELSQTCLRQYHSRHAHISTFRQITPCNHPAHRARLTWVVRFLLWPQSLVPCLLTVVSVYTVQPAKNLTSGEKDTVFERIITPTAYQTQSYERRHAAITSGQSRHGMDNKWEHAPVNICTTEDTL